MPGALEIDCLSFLLLRWGHGWFSAASSPYELLLHYRDEVFQSPLPLYPFVPSSSWDQHVRSWEVGMAEEHGEKIWVEEVEAWAEKVSRPFPFLVSSLIAPIGFFGVSFGYPSLLARSWVVKVG